MLNVGEMEKKSGIPSRLVTYHKAATACFTFLKQTHQTPYNSNIISAYKIVLITYLDSGFPSKY